MKKKKVQIVIYYYAKSNEQVFLLLKMNKRRNEFWQNITGGVDELESFTDAAIRESVEETNLHLHNITNLTPSNLEFSFTDQWKNDVIEKVFFLHCKESWNVEIDPKEHCQFKWVSEKDITSKSVHYQSNYQALLKAIEYQC